MATASDNALDVLLSALPSSVASSFEIEYATTSLASSATTSPSSSISVVLASPTSSMVTSHRPKHSTQTTKHNQPTATPVPDSSSAPHQLKNASIAGIATGSAAALVFILLVVLFLLRRKRQGKYPFKSSSPNRHSQLPTSDTEKAYPEVAWLYDPKRTPSQNLRAQSQRKVDNGHGQHERDGSADGLLAPREGAAELDSTPSESREYFTPPATPPRPRRKTDDTRYEAYAPPTGTDSSSSPEDHPLLAPVQAAPELDPIRPTSPLLNSTVSPVRSVSPASYTNEHASGASQPLLSPAISSPGGSFTGGPIPPSLAIQKNGARRKRLSTGPSSPAVGPPLTAIFEETNAGAGGALASNPPGKTDNKPEL